MQAVTSSVRAAPTGAARCSRRQQQQPAIRAFSGMAPAGRLDGAAASRPATLSAAVQRRCRAARGAGSRMVVRAMFERFTEKAIKVVMLAQEEARRLGHNFVGTEQILLGLIGESTGEQLLAASRWRLAPWRRRRRFCRRLPAHSGPTARRSAGIAAKVLKSMGVTLKDARVEVEKIIGRGSGFVAVEIPFTPRAKRVLELSLEEARALGAWRLCFIGRRGQRLAGNRQAAPRQRPAGRPALPARPTVARTRSTTAA